MRLYVELDRPDFWNSGPLRDRSHHAAALDVFEARGRDMRGVFGPGASAQAAFFESVAKEFSQMQSEAHAHLEALAAAYAALARAAGDALERVRAGRRTFDKRA